MQDAVSRNYKHTLTRIGDIAWRARFHSHSELGREIQLWEQADQLVGYTWLRTRGGFDVFIAAEHQDDRTLLVEMLDQIEDSVRIRVAAGDEPREVYTFFNPDDRAMANELEARGFAKSDESAGVVLCANLGSLHGPPEVPPGYRLDCVSNSDVVGRVEAHRAAFSPSDLTASLYERVRRTWPYRSQLDRVVKTEHGAVVAFCTAWIDDRNRAGLLEPVGTHPDHRERGLGRAVVTDALLSLRNAGATLAQVGTSGAAARRTYESAGFTEWAEEATFRKAIGPPRRWPVELATE
jgi:ribosomal protein S18 acetylase RimI-like enzyme